MLSKVGRTRLQQTFSYAVLGLACGFALLPVGWAILTSLKDASSVVTFPPTLVPNPVTLENYRIVVGSSVPRYFLNSLIVSLSTICLTLFVAAHAGYATERFSFTGKSSILFCLLATGMIPGICVLVPLYIAVSKLGLHNTYVALILVYSASQAPTAIWLTRGFIGSIPPQLDEAAMIDGCSRLRALYYVVLPLAQPGLAAVAILVFIFAWNEFLISLALTASDDMRLIQLGIYGYITAFGIEWGPLMAAVTVALVPVLLVFFLLQSRFIEGLTAGAIK